MPRSLLVAVLGLALSSCGTGGSEPVPPGSLPGFELQLSGAEARSLTGRVFVAPTVPDGFIDLDPESNALTTRPRTPVLFYPTDAEPQAMLTIDLIGVMQPTSYAAYIGGADGRGTRFLSAYSVRRSNGLAREYRLSGGTVVLTAVDASLVKGTVSIQFGGYVDPIPGSTTEPPFVPAPLSITGSFTAQYMPR